MSTIRYFKQGDKCIALVTLQTSNGPISLAASADEGVIAKALAQSTQVLSGSSYILVDEDTTRRAAELAIQIAKEGLMGQIADVTGNDSHAAASRLYLRLTQKDKGAWNAVRQLIARAKAGDANAQMAWTLLLQAHARANSKSLSSSAGTLEQRRAASRIYDRLQAGDKSAWQDLAAIAQGAEAGNTKSIHAWSILANVHEGRTRAVTVGAMNQKRLPASTAAQLTRMARAALMSKPRPQLSAGGWRAVTPRQLSGAAWNPTSTSSILLQSPNVGYRLPVG